MDDTSTNTSVCSLKTLVGQVDRWYGQLPCVCHNSLRGCHQHNPTQSLIYHNPRLPPKEQVFSCLTRALSSFWQNTWVNLRPKETSAITCEPLLIDVVSAKAPDPSPLFCTELPFDSQSVDTLTPIHPTMPYHLAFYHLECIRRRLDPDVKMAFIPELSCGGTSSFYHDGPRYTWSSEIYFDNGTFLQKQELSWILNENTNCGTLELAQCSHINLKIRAPWFKDVDGFLIAHAWLSFQPNHFEIWGFKRWTSKMGRFARISQCMLCHSDHEQTLELVGRQLHIRNTCYRDLGPATDRSIPRWITLLTGDRIRPTKRPWFGMYTRVWQTAQQLGRPNLHVVTHQTPDGEYVVGTL